MPKHEAVAPESLREVLQERLDLKDPFQVLRSTTGKFNETYFLEGQGLEQSLVVRIAPRNDRKKMIFYEHQMMRQEPELHRLLREKTTAPVPEVLYFEKENELLGRDFIVMERIHAEPMNATEPALIFEIGSKLRNVHETVRAAPNYYGYLGEHRPMEPQPTWQDAFRVMWNALMDDIAHCQGASQSEIQSWRGKFDTHASCFDHFKEPACLLHMDVWAENILVNSDGKLAGLVDWDRALWGDPEIEFAVLDYCGISTPDFWNGYGNPRGDDNEAEIRRVFYLLYEILKYIIIRIARNGNRAGAERFRKMAIPLLEQL